jgi:hypothetical protein
MNAAFAEQECRRKKVVSNQNISGCQMIKSISNSRRPIAKSFVGCNVMDNNAVDFCYFVIKPIAFKVKDKILITCGSGLQS